LRRRVTDVHTFEIELLLTVVEFGQWPLARHGERWSGRTSVAYPVVVEPVVVGHGNGIAIEHRLFVRCATLDCFAAELDGDAAVGVVLHVGTRGFASDDPRRVVVVVEVPASRRAI